jgi:glycyl-tRNA synthetase
VKLPFGIAQMGKSFRNEITPRNFTFRSREFEQMEIEFFCHPSESNKWYEYWRDTRVRWYTTLGLRSERLRLREHDKDELSHYSCGTGTSTTSPGTSSGIPPSRRATSRPRST